MEEKTVITVETLIQAPLEKVWEAWTKPEHITKWCYASDDWEAPEAENELRVEGRFRTRMQAKDKSAGFDFGGTFTVVNDKAKIEYDMDDDRHVKVVFTQTPEGVKVTESFEAESTHSNEQQRSGWQSILDNFKKYVEQL